MTPSIEELFAGHGFADIAASPLQLAITRASEGHAVGDELDDEAIERHFGCGRSRLGLAFPVLVVVVAGVRSGKSFLAACGALRDVFAADCSGMKAHEVARHAIVAPLADNADATFKILVGIVESSAVLRRLIVGEPTTDTLVMRRPDGRIVEIVVVAAHRGGTALRSRWLAGATLEEVAFFGIESQGAAVNAEELLRAAESRLLPRTQVRIVSSPMGRQGLLFELYKAHFGKPGAVLVVHAPTKAMNPAFPQSKIDAVRARDPDAAAREFDAQWIDGDTVFLDTALVESSVRQFPERKPPRMGESYVASMDPATRGNGWTLVVARGERIEDERVRVEVAFAHEWRGSREAPLSPESTMKELAQLVKPYRIERVRTDRWSFDAHQDHARRAGIELVECSVVDRDAAYSALQSTLASGLLELPPVPLLVQDLKGLRKVLTPKGFRVALPGTPDGRHCDYAPSTAMSVWRARIETHFDQGGELLAFGRSTR